MYTDGACIHPGTKRQTGVCSVFVSPGNVHNAVRSTREGHVTNQTMELAAALAGLEAIDAILLADPAAEAEMPCPTVYTASSYVMSCMTKWLPRWERTGWITKQRRAVQNGDVLRKMAEIARRRNVRFMFVAIVDLIGTRVTPPASDAPVLPPGVRDGMVHARQLLVDVTSSTSSTPDAGSGSGNGGGSTGCSKRRNVLCTWMGG